jgi:hypothetical protein
LGEAIAARFANRHAGARKPLQRFLAIARDADWPHFGRLIFNVSRNRYRLIASVDFQEQVLVIERVLTHEDYSREVL